MKKYNYKHFTLLRKEKKRKEKKRYLFLFAILWSGLTCSSLAFGGLGCNDVQIHISNQSDKTFELMFNNSDPKTKVSGLRNVIHPYDSQVMINAEGSLGNLGGGASASYRISGNTSGYSDLMFSIGWGPCVLHAPQLYVTVVGNNNQFRTTYKVWEGSFSGSTPARVYIQLDK